MSRCRSLRAPIQPTECRILPRLPPIRRKGCSIVIWEITRAGRSRGASTEWFFLVRGAREGNAASGHHVLTRGVRYRGGWCRLACRAAAVWSARTGVHPLPVGLCDVVLGCNHDLAGIEQAWLEITDVLKHLVRGNHMGVWVPVVHRHHDTTQEIALNDPGS